MNVDYSNYYYRQKSKKKQPKFKNLLAIFLIIGCFAAFFLLYPKIKDDNPFLRAVESKGHIEVYEQFYYAVETGRFTSEGGAKTFAEHIKNAGGAGYIFTENEVFYVFTSLYFKQEDAEKVSAKLKNSGYNSAVFPMIIPHSYIPAKVKLTEVSKCLGYVYELLDSLEELNNALALKKTDLKAALDILNGHRSAITDLMSNFNSSGLNSVQNSEIRTYYLNIVSALDELKTSASSEQELNVETRHLGLDVLSKYILLLDHLQK